MIEVYVAGASRRWLRARAFMERVHAHPRMRNAFDWTLGAEAASVHDDALTDDERSTFARTDVDALARADVLVVLAEDEPASRGMWFELGYAARMRDWHTSARTMRIIVSGGGRRSIFTSPADVGFVDFECVYDIGDRDGDAFVALLQYAELDESITRSAIGDLAEESTPTRRRSRIADRIAMPDMADPEIGRMFNTITAANTGLIFSNRARIAGLIVAMLREVSESPQ